MVDTVKVFSDLTAFQDLAMFAMRGPSCLKVYQDNSMKCQILSSRGMLGKPWNGSPIDAVPSRSRCIFAERRRFITAECVARKMTARDPSVSLQARIFEGARSLGAIIPLPTMPSSKSPVISWATILELM